MRNNTFVEDSLVTSIDDLLFHYHYVKTLFKKESIYYNRHLTYSKESQLLYRDKMIPLKWQTFSFAKDVSSDDMCSALDRIIDYNYVVVFGDVTVADNIELHLACFTKEAFNEALSHAK